ncbi:peptidase M3 [Porphyromonas gulae]|uniref:M3 family metallopeptidase n=1 Tax=Porphyromonas gulae TaxID=111105 RepID=UPI00052B660D|nr:M3 family metallopeptidase [Porphyromonas gulae]KGO02196.1 peptidase M3 [Porphyromonas gulae]
MNPFLQPFDTPFGSYPFDKISIADFKEAFAYALAEKRAEADAIINSTEPPTFANTILALELCGEKLELVCGAFFNLLHADSNDELMNLSQEIMPELTRLSTDIALSEPLFGRIRTVWESDEKEKLSEEEKRLLYNCYRGFVDSGALLPTEKKDRLRTLSEEMSMASLTFGQNVLKDEKRYKLHLSDPAAVAGMPETALALASEKARREGYTYGWLFDLSAPSYFAFMKHCPDGNLRRQMYEAKMCVGFVDNEYNNEALVRRMVNGRLEEARLLGYDTFAHFALHDRMAKNPKAVQELLDKLLDAYKPKATQELEMIRQWAADKISEADNFTIQPWDWAYFSEQYKQAHYDLDDEMMRPYFELGRVTRGIFGLANRLYGLHFSERTDVPVYHPDVKVYEVSDEDGSYIGLLYTDFFPREGKQNGAWMNNLRDQSEHQHPHIIIVMNFTPPSADKPSLLTAGEVETFLHEFGHALHGMLSKCRFSSLSGTSVARDFVELPSQIMENWLTEKEFLDTFARHYITDEPMPRELVEKLLSARNYLAASGACRQLSFGYLDMAWHGLSAPVDDKLDIKAFEEAAWSKALILPPSPPNAVMSTAFGHIFSGGYAAGYYGYKWAEVLDADAFAAFKEVGIFDREVAGRFRREILERGDTADAMELYVAFRGHEPDIAPLLKRTGLA